MDPHEVIVAGTLEEGLEELARIMPDVALLDMNLPDSDGLETVRRLRAASEAVPIVVLTGTDDLKIAVSALREGADDYIAKMEMLREGALLRPIRYALERRRVLNELHFAVRARAELLAIVSHDVRNHLSTIDLGVRLIRGGPVPDAFHRPLAAIARASATSLRLLDDLVDLAAVERGGLAVSVTDIDVAPIVRESYDAFSSSAEQKSLRLELDVVDTVLAARGDAVRITQVLGNLIGNALKFTPSGGVVTVRARGTPDEVTLSVVDTGPGIPKEERARIFERFFRGSKPSGKGVGLGLAIARALVESQGGRIWVESEEGRGAVFSFCLPTRDADYPLSS
jgi:signal transduction histidine kinase